MRSFNGVQLNSIEIFCKAAEKGSFTVAAETLGLTPATVSRSISRLENRLGIRLFTRTTRQVSLTREGSLYWHECARALDQILDAERLITGKQKVPSGILRISVGTLYANHRLLPQLPKFTAAYPQIELDLSLTNRDVDLVDGGYDLAIRLGIPKDSRLIARKLETASLGIFGSPAYFKNNPKPTQLDQLSQHECIQFIVPDSGRPMNWAFTNDKGKDVDLSLSGRQKIFDDPLGCITLAKAGGGLCQTYHFLAEPFVKSGELVEVLNPFAGRSRQFSILYPQNRHLSARVRAFVDYFTHALDSKQGSA